MKKALSNSLDPFRATMRTALFLLAVLLLTTPLALGQFTTPTLNGSIGASEYGDHTEGRNRTLSNVSEGLNWYMTWDATNLYVAIQNGTGTFNAGAGADAINIYIDSNPITPVNGGTSPTLTGTGFDSVTPALPFAADYFGFSESGFSACRRANGSGGWLTPGTCTINRFGGSGVLEISIPWNDITNGAGRPSSLNMLLFASFSGGTFARSPIGNGGGTTPSFVRYFTISNTNDVAATKPFSQESYASNACTISGFGGITVWDFTYNAGSGCQLTRTTTGGAASNWTINNELIVSNAGTLFFGNTFGGPSSFGGTLINGNTRILGTATLDADGSTTDLDIRGNILIDSGAKLELSDVAGADLLVRGNLTANGTFTPLNRAVFFQGTAAQTIGGATSEITIPFLYVNSGSNVTANRPVRIIGTSGTSVFGNDGTYTSTGFLTTFDGGGSPGVPITGTGTTSFGDVVANAGVQLNLRKPTLMGSLTTNGPLSLPTTAGQNLTLTGNLALNSTLETNGRTLIFQGATAKAISGAGAVTGAFNVQQTGAGELTWGGSSTFSSTTDLNITGTGSVRLSRDLTLTSFTQNATGRLFLNSDAVVLTTADPGGLGAATFSRTLSGDAGWRMLSAPQSGLTVGALAAINLVQSVTGQYPTWTGDNLFLSYDGAGNEVGFIPAADVTDVIEPGEGFIWYLFDNSLTPNPGSYGGGTSVSVPVASTTLAVPGGTPVTAHRVDLNTAGDDFSLIGNPYGHNFDLTKLVGVGNPVPLAGTIWQDGAGAASAGAEAEVTGSYVNSSTQSNRIATWQGMFVQNAPAANASRIVFPNLGKSDAVTPFNRVAASTAQRYVNLTLKGYDAARNRYSWDEAATLYLAPGATEAWDGFDLTKLAPLSSYFATLAFEGLREGESTLKAQESRDFELAGTLRLPVSLETYNMQGTFEVGAVLQGIPSDWAVRLVDRQTGEEADLRRGPHTFTVAQARVTTLSEDALALPRLGLRMDRALARTGAPRFELVVEPGGAVATEEDTAPHTFDLEGNYPNPFNPTTTVAYTLHQPADVRLAVYDVLGREVAVLVQGAQARGRHEVTFEAAELSSGVYLYRLEAAGRVETRTMLLLK